MSGNFTGMDIQQVRDLAAQLEAKAGEIETIRQQLTGQIEGAQWIGPDRDKFHSEWTGQYCTALNRVMEGLRGAAANATRNANEQEQASNA